jgi:hypothetical protein
MVVFGFACKHKIILFSSIDGAAEKIKFQGFYDNAYDDAYDDDDDGYNSNCI